MDIAHSFMAYLWDFDSIFVQSVFMGKWELGLFWQPK